GDKVVGNLPTYKGPGAAVGGPAGELQKNFSALSDLDKAYKAQLAALDAFRSTDLAKQKIYDEAKAKLDADYAQKSHAIEIARQQLTLSASADFFGQVAQLQHSSNNKIAAIGKAAAIAQAMIKTYESATSAYAALAGIPIIGPALGAAAAAVAVGVGLANVAQIRAQPSSFDGGGYTGAGGRLEPAGIVHRGEVVFSQDDVARHGGASAVEALRLGYPAYADGGFVDAIAGNRGPAMPDIDTRGTRSPSVSNKMRVYVLQNEDQLAQRLAQHPATEKGHRDRGRRKRHGHPGEVVMGIVDSTDVPWTIVPDWSNGVQESLSWSTDVMQANATAVTQHRSLRASPRRSFTFALAADAQNRRAADMLLAGHSGLWPLPIWP